jgi:integrase
VATYRKRNGKWQAIVRHKEIGTRARSFHTKQAAIKWVISVEEQLEAGTFGTLRPTHITLGELLVRYACEVTPSKRGALTEGQRLQRLIRDPVSGLKVSQLTSQAVAAFRDRRRLDGRRTCHYDLILIRHCLKIAMNEWGLMLSSNPVDRVKMPPSSPARNRRLEDGEFNRLEEAAKQTRNPHIWPVIVFAIETGMRRGEILGLEWEHVDLDRRIAYLPLTKNGSSREVPLSTKAAQVLAKQRQRNDTSSPFPVTPNGFRLAWDRLRSRAGLSDLRFHDLRHEAISRFFELGLNIPEVAVISGHKDPRMLFRYTHLRAEKLIQKLD